MAESTDTMITPGLEDLLSKVDSRFTLVSLAAMRSRQINSYYNQLDGGIGAVVPPQVASVARKPLSIAFEEIDADKITFERFDPEERAREAAEALAAAQADGVQLEVLEGLCD
ncbi:DNA-directed RNA polymerase subunit omega [Candidatus Poriferisodalis sp.]|uniref:DNA-directed RNA polymerase subunit omega n=1 Tax=Candidatus Poriferisodalis sp. TaxID=3101277 RepID=UPI003B01C479